VTTAERELVDRIARGDRVAMTRLYEMYMPRLARFLQRITQDSALIDELVNDVMMSVWQHADTFRGDSAVSTWILGIAYRRGLDAVRKRKRYQELLRAAPAQQSPPGVGELVANRDLDALLLELTPEQRAVAELSFHFGFSYPEIAETLDLPVNTVKTRMFYARRKMQSVFASAGG